MKSELQEKLFNDYSIMFDNRHKSPMESCLAFGLEIGDGWYDLVRSVCWMIKQHENNKQWQKEWREKKNQETKDSTGTDIQDDEPEYFAVKFDQVKEKYGGLRLYFSGGDEYIEGLVSLAEAYSYHVCEICGNKGEANKQGWIAVRCEACRNS